METLLLTEKNGANYILYELSGTLSTYTSTEFQEKVYENIQHTNIVFDCSGIEAIDSVGVGIFMATFNDGETYGHKLFLMNPSPALRQSLEDTGFYSLFNLIHSVTEIA